MIKKIITGFLLILLTHPLTVHSQITIGSQKEPETFSILELESDKGGLRHPQMNTVERNELLRGIGNKTEAYGLTIFNTDTKCIEFYRNDLDGWVSLCASNNIVDIPIDDKGAVLRPFLASDGNVTQGKYGKQKYDIAKGNSGGSCGTLGAETGRPGDFNTNDDKIRNYLIEFPSVLKVTDLIVGKYKDPYGIIKTVSGDIAGEVSNLKNTIIVTFVSDIKDRAQGTKENNALKATLYGIFKRDGVLKRVEYTITVMDCLGCGVRISSDKNWIPVMCYNLGAEETKNPFSHSLEIEGDSYQWGRQKDGHENIDSEIYYPEVALGEINYPTLPADEYAAGGQVPSSNARYGLFIPSSASIAKYFSYDWRAEQSNVLWGDGTQRLVVRKGPADPCPSGFRLPTYLELESIINEMTYNTTKKGAEAKEDGNLFIPNTQFRTINGDKSTSADGQYWTSTTATAIPSTEAHEIWTLNLSSSASKKISTKKVERTFSSSVRCIAE